MTERKRLSSMCSYVTGGGRVISLPYPLRPGLSWKDDTQVRMIEGVLCIRKPRTCASDMGPWTPASEEWISAHEAELEKHVRYLVGDDFYDRPDWDARLLPPSEAMKKGHFMEWAS